MERWKIKTIKKFRNRSELILEALRSYISNKEKWGQLFSYGKSIGKKINISNEKEVNKIVAEFRHKKK